MSFILSKLNFFIKRWYNLKIYSCFFAICRILFFKRLLLEDKNDHKFWNSLCALQGNFRCLRHIIHRFTDYKLNIYLYQVYDENMCFIYNKIILRDSGISKSVCHSASFTEVRNFFYALTIGNLFRWFKIH